MRKFTGFFDRYHRPLNINQKVKSVTQEEYLIVEDHEFGPALFNIKSNEVKKLTIYNSIYLMLTNAG